MPNGIDRIEARPLSNEEIGQRLRAVTAMPAPGSLGPEADELRLSVAGAQEKTAFLLHERQWCLPLGSTPTTHLFKLPMGVIGEGQVDFSTSVENEWLCGRLLRAYGLPMASTEMARFDGERCLIVQRFDRRLHSSGTYWLRLPSEDCCQATSTPIMATGDFPFLGFPASPTSRRAGSLRRRLRCRLNRSSYRLVSLLKWRQDARVIQAFRRDRLGLAPLPWGGAQSRRRPPAQLANPPVLHLISSQVLPRPEDWKASASLTGFCYLEPRSADGAILPTAYSPDRESALSRLPMAAHAQAGMA